MEVIEFGKDFFNKPFDTIGKLEESIKRTFIEGVDEQKKAAVILKTVAVAAVAMALVSLVLGPLDGITVGLLAGGVAFCASVYENNLVDKAERKVRSWGWM